MILSRQGYIFNSQDIFPFFLHNIFITKYGHEKHIYYYQIIFICLFVCFGLISRTHHIIIKQNK